MERAGARLSAPERVRRFILADEPFSTGNGQMTATLKTRRHVVREAYGGRLDALYGTGGKAGKKAGAKAGKKAGKKTRAKAGKGKG